MKANFNWDKGAESGFGFTRNYDVECWEFKDNTTEGCNFTGNINDDNWSDSFEARYPDGSTNITRLKEMHDWVVSTNRNAATNEALSDPVTYDGVTYNADTAEYRLAKFAAEFEDRFNLHYTLIYYVYTFFALMVDQRAKNLFLTYWGKTGRWYPYFYDKCLS